MNIGKIDFALSMSAFDRTPDVNQQMLYQPNLAIFGHEVVPSEKLNSTLFASVFVTLRNIARQIELDLLQPDLL